MTQKRAAADAAPKAKVDLARVEEIFATAKNAGKKFPKLRLDGMVLSLAGANSRNAGAIYVKAGPAFEDDYFGKVIGGEFHKVRTAPESITTALQALAADPLSSAGSLWPHNRHLCLLWPRTDQKRKH